MDVGSLVCYGTMALLILVPATVIWLINRRSGISLVNILPLKIKEFERINPGLKIITAGATNARMVKSDQKPRDGIGWAVSRRSVLILSKEGLHCGKWFLPLNTITEATLIKTPTVYILKVGTSDDTYYQFGLKKDPAWEEQTILPIDIEYSNKDFSIRNVAIRSLFAAYILWVVIGDITQQSFTVITVLEIGAFIFVSVPIVRYIKNKVEMEK